MYTSCYYQNQHICTNLALHLCPVFIISFSINETILKDTTITALDTIIVGHLFFLQVCQ